MNSSGPKDKNGILIEHGDLLKVYHYTNRRNQKCYMYKMALRTVDGRLFASHMIIHGYSANGVTLLPDFSLETREFNPGDFEVIQSNNQEKLWKF